MGDYYGETLPLEMMTDQRLVRAHRYWQDHCHGHPFPARTDIAPEEMKPFLSNVMLIDIRHDPLDFVYRVFGTSIAVAHGADYTGKSVRSLDPPEFSTIIWGQYKDVLDRGTPVLHRVAFAPADAYRNYQRITMPLSSDGTIIDKLLAVSDEDHSFWEKKEAAPGPGRAKATW